MRKIPQKCKNSCAIATIAMLTNRSYKEIERYAIKDGYKKNKRGVNTFNVLTEMGFQISSSDKADHFPCLASVKWENLQGESHSIYLYEKNNKLMFYDPAANFSKKSYQWTWPEILYNLEHIHYLVHDKPDNKLTKVELFCLNAFRCDSDIEWIVQKTGFSRKKIGKLLINNGCF